MTKIDFESISLLVIFKVYIKKSLGNDKVDGIKHSFTALSEKFGHKRPLEDVFELFGEFKKEQRDVLFDVSFHENF